MRMDGTLAGPIQEHGLDQRTPAVGDLIGPVVPGQRCRYRINRTVEASSHQDAGAGVLRPAGYQDYRAPVVAAREPPDEFSFATGVTRVWVEADDLHGRRS